MRSILNRLIRWATRGDDCVVASRAVTADSGRIPNNLSLYITAACGGLVITARHYNAKTDRSSESVYVVVDTDKLGEELAHIIAMENLVR
jgi:hypothetical protein